MDDIKAAQIDAEEQSIVRRAASGDGEAFGRLYDLYVQRIYRYLHYRLGNSTEAEDLTEEVFVKAWQAIGGFKWREGNFAGWIFRIAHNLLVDHFRTHRQTLPLEAALHSEAATQEPEVTLGRIESRREIEEALNRLTPEQREVILLRFIQGYSSREAAKIMGKSEEAVRALQYRALTSLARMIGQVRQG